MQIFFYFTYLLSLTHLYLYVYTHTHTHTREHVCTDASVVFNSLLPHELQPTRFLCPWDSPGKNTGVGCHFFLQGIFPTQESKLHLLHLLNWQGDYLRTAKLKTQIWEGCGRAINNKTEKYFYLNVYVLLIWYEI